MKETMTPDQRLREVAEILATAVLRLRVRAALPALVPDAEKPAESTANCLAVRPEMRLSVHTG
jgi:hypothetical protein